MDPVRVSIVLKDDIELKDVPAAVPAKIHTQDPYSKDTPRVRLKIARYVQSHCNLVLELT